MILRDPSYGALVRLLARAERSHLCDIHVADDLYLGGFIAGGVQGINLQTTPGNTNWFGPTDNPTANQGVGPAGRVFHHNIVPLTKQAAQLAALQAPTSGTGLTLFAGTGITLTTAPDGSGAAAYRFDSVRSVSLTSTANLSAINFLISGDDWYGRPQTQLMAGPNNNTVNSLKTFGWVKSIVPQGTSASQLSAGYADIFGMPYRVNDKTYLVDVLWANSFTTDTGTFTVADGTSPATSATGDVRGTYAPSSASNGSNRLIIGMHLDATQCGVGATLANAIGVTPA